MWPAGRSTRSWPGTRGSTSRKLGAMADRFGRSFYGEMEDEINRGDRTDRLVVRWDLDRDPRPREIPGGRPDGARGAGRSRAAGAGAGIGTGPAGAAIEVPRDHAVLRRGDAALGARWRDAAADAFETCFAAGLVVGAFDRARSAYLLMPEAAREPRRCGGAAAGRAAARPAVPHELREMSEKRRPGARRDGRGRGLGRVRRRHRPEFRRGVQRRRLARPARLPRPGAPPAPSKTWTRPSDGSPTSAGTRWRRPRCWTRSSTPSSEPTGTSLAAWLGGVRVTAAVSTGSRRRSSPSSRSTGTWPRVTGGSLQDRAGDRPRARPRRPRGAPRHPAVRRRERRVHAGRRAHVPVDGRARA